MSQIFNMISIASYVVAGVMLLITLILYKRLNIRKVIGDLSGHTARKYIKEQNRKQAEEKNKRKQNASASDNNTILKSAADRVYAPTEANLSNDSVMSEITKNDIVIKHVSGGLVSESKTTVLSATELLGNETMLVGSGELKENATTVLSTGELEGATTVLSEDELQGVTTVLSEDELQGVTTVLSEDELQGVTTVLSKEELGSISGSTVLAEDFTEVTAVRNMIKNIENEEDYAHSVTTYQVTEELTKGLCIIYDKVVTHVSEDEYKNI